MEESIKHHAKQPAKVEPKQSTRLESKANMQDIKPQDTQKYDPLLRKSKPEK